MSALLLAVLLLAPIALAGHVHVDHQARNCAVCVVGRHTPALGALAPVTLTPVVISVPVPAIVFVAVSRAPQARALGRAPPRLLPSALA
jgi:hypothetical protein